MFDMISDMAMYTDDRRSEEEKEQGNFALGFLGAALCFPFGALAAIAMGGPKTRAGAVLGSGIAIVLIIAGIGISGLMALLT